MIHPARMHPLNNRPVRAAGRFVLYWMQQSQRAEWNHALEYAIERANALNLPVAVVVGLMDNAPDTTGRQNVFKLQGLTEKYQTLEKRGLGTFIGRAPPAEVALQAGRDAALIVCDMGYLRHQAEWRACVADEANCAVVEIESDAIIPVETASDHAEYMARTLRPKLLKNLSQFLQPVHKISVVKLWNQRDHISGCTRHLPESDTPTSPFTGGITAAKTRLKTFISASLPVYEKHSNQPQTSDVSRLSPYLHFGQISPLYIALEIQKHDPENRFLEQLLVRRELAINFVWFTPDYDRLTCLPDWAQQTLRRHASDKRSNLYTRDQLEQSQTHDPYWNAAMTDMRITGFMHNYMRMDWGKKILEWSRSPEEAFDTLLAINNKYFLDGHDPNSYAGVAWVFGKHDTAWKERPIFGKVRYMNAAGLKRKCDIEKYVESVKRRV